METPFRAFGGRHLDQLLRERTNFDGEERLQAQAVAAVLPFRINQYVLDELIDWSAVPNDPIYRLTFPQPGMLVPADLDRMVGLLRSDAAPGEVAAAVHQIRRRLNPHPAGQLDQNTPYLEGERLSGMQHKYRETLLVFPRQGQTCHAYCSYCFRWPQFVGDQELKIATDDVATMVNYLHRHPEITSVLITGGDPLIMRTAVLRRYLEPLLAIDTVESIRIGTKALSYWPHRVLTDPDAADLLALFRQVVAAGKHLAVMGHYSHPRELEPAPAREAVARVLATGAVIRSQAPMIRGVNDDADAWARLWREQTRLSIVPYYMFMERDTGAQHYFSVPLARAYELFRTAYQQVSGLARTVRGPVMSATPGKVCVDGVAEIHGERVFALRMLQARDPRLVGRPFFAQYDPDATWLTDLKPALGAQELLPVPLD
ncbi:MAG TPA: lysine 2,3-aminomutase [Natronosporangium sp.]|nr:lysine 2,3-aminomutase [Natronosporangium sp.]